MPTTRCSWCRSDELAPFHGGDLHGPGEKQRVAGLECVPGDPGSTGLQELGSSQYLSPGALSPELGPGEEMARGLSHCPGLEPISSGKPLVLPCWLVYCVLRRGLGAPPYPLLKNWSVGPTARVVVPFFFLMQIFSILVRYTYHHFKHLWWLVFNTWLGGNLSGYYLGGVCPVPGALIELLK